MIRVLSLVLLALSVSPPPALGYSWNRGRSVVARHGGSDYYGGDKFYEYYGKEKADAEETTTKKEEEEPEPVEKRQWLEWEEWFGCSATCGSGLGSLRARSRDCPPPPGGYDGDYDRSKDRGYCEGSPFERKECDIPECSNILVIGGYKDKDKKKPGKSVRTADVEIVSLNYWKYPECEKPADLPFPMTNMEAAYVDGRAVICGGHKDAPRYESGELDSCYEYADGGWREASFGGPGHRARSGLVLPDGSWLLLGGNQTHILSKGKLERGQDIKFWDGVLGGSCMVNLNETHFFLGDEYGVYVVDAERWEWTRLRNYTRDVKCGLVKTKDGRREVLLLFNKDRWSYFMEQRESDGRSLFFDPETAEFRPGPCPPASLEQAAVVQGEDTFVLVGGKRGVKAEVAHSEIRSG